jgi:hypothetical protein
LYFVPWCSPAFAREVHVNRGEGRVRQRLAVQKRRQNDALGLKRGQHFELGSLGHEAIDQVGLARDGLRVVSQQERRFIAGQHPIVQLAGDHQGALDGHVRSQSIRQLAHFQRPELAGRGLDPELRAGHFIDVARIAGRGELAEIDFGHATAFGRGANARKQKMGPGRNSRAG